MSTIIPRACIDDVKLSFEIYFIASLPDIVNFSAKYFVLSKVYTNEGDNISIFHGCMVWIEKSVTRVTDRHHEACRVMPNSDPE